MQKLNNLYVFVNPQSIILIKGIKHNSLNMYFFFLSFFLYK